MMGLGCFNVWGQVSEFGMLQCLGYGLKVWHASMFWVRAQGVGCRPESGSNFGVKCSGVGGECGVWSRR